ncbi:hypothetical protein [Lysobacter sp. CFH 32150]|uniref:hypothetical protein n=1 Tax=Lysobacter sp. CFH 32150 TaxID=2927128 RepID=UPI001FA6B170|nr:hypothetical protein [Lysobacter sp. CFH 32150]MCI4568240.1 hypothetical protein [Lysobacter sp. CFH 32150]
MNATERPLPRALDAGDEGLRLSAAFASEMSRCWLAINCGSRSLTARFYEKCGWHRTGIVTSQVDTPDGVLPLQVWRYERHLRQGARLDGASG